MNLLKYKSVGGVLMIRKGLSALLPPKGLVVPSLQASKHLLMVESIMPLSIDTESVMPPPVWVTKVPSYAAMGRSLFDNLISQSLVKRMYHVGVSSAATLMGARRFFNTGGITQSLVKRDMQSGDGPDSDGPLVVFDGLFDRAISSWTSIVLGYVQNGQPLEALRIFSQMSRLNEIPDWVALMSFVRAYSNVDGLKQGKSVHSCVIKMGLELEPNIFIALAAMYAECGEVQVATILFNQIKEPTLFLWNAMISGYATNGYADEAVEIFRMMISDNVRPDTVSLKSAIRACAQVGSVELAIRMEDFTSRSEHKYDAFVNTYLIEMYAKVGSLGNARKVFERTSKKDVAVWNSMIVSYGHAGDGSAAMDLFHRMGRAEVKPNDVTFVGVLLACHHSGWIQEGVEYFLCMRGDYGIVPRLVHYALMVDIIGGSGGCLEEAYDFIIDMPIEPDLSVWRAFLSASKIHRNVKFGELAAERVFLLDPLNAEAYVQLSNLYESVEMWDHVARVEVLMRERGLSKDLGYCLIEINGKLQAFRMGDRSHPKSKEIYQELDRLEWRIKESGFVPTNEDKEEMMCNHSEKLAIAFGLISTPPGTIIRIMKNLQACGSCHSAIKVISEVVGREIVVRDANRFHHFKEGRCSCEIDAIPRRSQ